MSMEPRCGKSSKDITHILNIGVYSMEDILKTPTSPTAMHKVCDSENTTIPIKTKCELKLEVADEDSQILNIGLYSTEDILSAPSCDRTFKCNACDYVTFDDNLLDKHASVHCDNAIVKCEEDPRVVSIRSTNYKKHACNICGYTSAYQTNITRHMNAHSGEKLYKCHGCEYSATSKCFLAKHIARGYSEKPLACGFCAFETRSACCLRTHRYTQHANEKPLKCTQCEFSTWSRMILKRHTTTHTGKSIFKCTDCGYSVQHLSKLQQHRLKHSLVKAYGCDQCNYRTNRKTSLQRHLRTHLMFKPYKCNQCDYAASTLSYFNIHVRVAHPTFEPSQSTNSGMNESNLTSHIKAHTGIKLFKCEMCEYSTHYGNNLKKHIRIHNGDKPFKCTECSYSTGNSSNLQCHVQTHKSNDSNCDSLLTETIEVITPSYIVNGFYTPIFANVFQIV